MPIIVIDIIKPIIINEFVFVTLIILDCPIFMSKDILFILCSVQMWGERITIAVRRRGPGVIQGNQAV